MATAAEKKAAEEARRAALTQEERDAEDVAKAPETKSTKAKSTEPVTVKFRDHEGKPTERTFSKEVHGENFADLADEFKATNADKLITE